MFNLLNRQIRNTIWVKKEVNLRVKKRVLGGLFLALILCSVAGAECVTNDSTIMWTDAEKFLAIARVIQVAGQDSPQAKAMMMNDIQSGVAIILSKGTKINVVSRPNQWVVVCNLGGTPLCGLAEFVSCR